MSIVFCIKYVVLSYCWSWEGSCSVIAVVVRCFYSCVLPSAVGWVEEGTESVWSFYRVDGCHIQHGRSIKSCRSLGNMYMHHPSDQLHQNTDAIRLFDYSTDRSWLAICSTTKASWTYWHPLHLARNARSPVFTPSQSWAQPTISSSTSHHFTINAASLSHQFTIS